MLVPVETPDSLAQRYIPSCWSGKRWGTVRLFSALA